MPQESRPAPQPGKDAEDLMEIYSDSMQIDSSLYTAILTFGEMRKDEPPLHRVRIRVSPHMLKAISLLTAKHVREFEGKTGGKILLPNDLVHQWGLEEEIG
jgi:hypothetical protein